VRASPGSHRDAVEGVGRDASGRSFLKVRLRAPADRGRANEALEALLARALDLPASSVHVEKGRTKRVKRVRISASPSIASRLEALTGEPPGGRE
jgi:hypothetical protein